jgi:hypothetical protein
MVTTSPTIVVPVTVTVELARIVIGAIGALEYVNSASPDDVPAGAISCAVVVASTEPAWLGVANVKLASSPAAKDMKTERLIIENSWNVKSIS